MQQQYPRSEQEVAELLKSRGIAPTRQRIELGMLLLTRACHVTADALYDLAREQNLSVSRATVYNTLRAFIASGLLNEVVIGDNAKYYDSNLRPHQHLYNIATGELTDVDSELLALRHAPELPPGAMVEGIDIVVRYRAR